MLNKETNKPVIGFIPVRAGSKGVPGKNKKNLIGLPLFSIQVDEMINSGIFNKIFISTDDIGIKDFTKQLYDEEISQDLVCIHDREKKDAEDTTSTEQVIFSFLQKYFYDDTINPDTIFYLVQVTNPFTTSKDYFDSFKFFNDLPEGDKTVFSGVVFNKFLWQKSPFTNIENLYFPLNYSPLKRKKRQDIKSSMVVENGAFYISTIKTLLTNKARIGKESFCYIMPFYTLHEIDTEEDWKICESLYRKFIHGLKD